MAEGALHVLSARRATTTPEPKRPEPRKPALKTVMMARPWIARLVSAAGLRFDGGLLGGDRVLYTPLHLRVLMAV